MKNIKYCILIIFTCLCVCNTYAQSEKVQVQYFRATSNDTAFQKENKTFEKEERNNALLQKIGVGGTLGLQIGNYTCIELSPEISYHFNKWICLGVGGTYMFSHIKTATFADNSHVFGVKGFVESHFFNYIALHAEYQWLNYNLYNSFGRTYSHNILLGGGLYQKSGRIAYYILLFYNWSNKQYPDNVLSDFVTRAGLTVFLK